MSKAYYGQIDYPDDADYGYIGRTSAHYGDDPDAEDSMFVPDYWASADDPDELAGDVHKLTKEGAEWLDQYYWDLGAGYDLCYGRAKSLAAEYSKEEAYEHLTDPKNGLSTFYRE